MMGEHNQEAYAWAKRGKLPMSALGQNIRGAGLMSAGGEERKLDL